MASLEETADPLQWSRAEAKALSLALERSGCTYAICVDCLGVVVWRTSPLPPSPVAAHDCKPGEHDLPWLVPSAT